jgi:hypothetical protein
MKRNSKRRFALFLAFCMIVSSVSNGGVVKADTDTTPPTVEEINVSGETASSAEFTVQMNEVGTVTYIVSTDASVSNVDDVLKSKEKKTIEITEANKEVTETLTGLDPVTDYYIHAVGTDAVGNNSTSVKTSSSFKTSQIKPEVEQNPTVSGTYGTALSAMDIDGGVVTANGIEIDGTWAVDDSAKSELPTVGGTTKYKVTFTPEDSTTYALVSVDVVPEVTARKISKCTIAVKGDDDKDGGKIYYTGAEKKPTIVVKDDNDKTLTENTDYTISYKQNTDVGKNAMVTITGIGNYKGTKNKSFTIEYYTDGSATAAVKDKNGANAVTGWSKEDVTICAPSGYTISETIDGTYAASFTYDKDTEASGDDVTYYLKQDTTGYILAAQTVNVKIDKIAPTFGEGKGIKIVDASADTDTWWNQLLAEIGFNSCYKEEKEVEITPEDNGSGIDKIYYYIDNAATETAKTSTDLDALGSGAWQEYNSSSKPKISSESNNVIYAYAVDNAGNKSDYICSDGVVIDKTAPTITSAKTSERTNKSAKLTVEMSEAGTVTYIVTASPAPTDSPTVQTILDTVDTSKFTANVEESGGKYVATADITKLDESTELQEDTTYYVYVVGTDKAGNNVSAAKSVDSFTTLKVTKPTITTTYGTSVGDMPIAADGKVQDKATGSYTDVKGTWSVTDSHTTDIPSVGTDSEYELTFTPEDNTGKYGKVTVKVKPTVGKQNYTDKTVNKDYYYDRDNEESIDLSAYLPSDCGTSPAPTFTDLKKGTDDGIRYTTEPSISGSTLTYTVKKGESDKSGTITITVTTQNYQNYKIVLKINLTGQKKVAVKKDTAVALKDSTLVYGETLSNLEFAADSAIFVVEGTNEVVNGTLEWKDKTLAPTVGTTSVKWVFKPTDATYYKEFEGEVAISVSKAKPYIATVPKAGEITYGDTLASSALTDGKAVYGDGKGAAGTGDTSSREIAGKFSWKDASVKPELKDSDSTAYKVVFTPTDSANYETVEFDVKLTVKEKTDTGSQTGDGNKNDTPGNTNPGSGANNTSTGGANNTSTGGEKKEVSVKEEVTVTLGKSITIDQIVDDTSGFEKMTLESASKYKKYFTVNSKTGKITTKKYYKVKIKKNIPVTVVVNGTKYTVNVKIKIPAPSVKVKKKKVKINGVASYKFTFSYNVKGAKKIQVRLAKGGSSSINKYLDKYISSAKSKRNSYIQFSSKTIKKIGNKVTFKIVATYGKNNKSETKKVTLKVK